MGKQNIYVMIGLPGAGKDTWIKNNLPNIECVVCRDDIRAELGYCSSGEKIVGTPEQENIVTNTFNTALLMQVRSGKDVVINNTNLRKKYRMQYHRLLKDFDLNWVYIVIKAPSLQDNIKRRSGQIPPEVFERLEKSYEPPTPDEYNEIRVFQQ